MIVELWRGVGTHPMPALTPDQVRAVDEAAPDLDELIGRAGSAVARVAVEFMGGTYGRRVTVIAGPGNNGADGRVAAERLAARGALVDVVPPTAESIASCDLVVDAAFGTGLSRPYSPPIVPSHVPVLAVDVPSGLDALTGHDLGALPAEVSVTFSAPKSGMFLGAGPDLCGRVVVVDIGLDLDAAQCTTFVVDDQTASALLPTRSRRSHKWTSGVRVVAGSPGMWGACVLSASAAARAGAGMVVASGSGADLPSGLPTEVVSRTLNAGRPAERAVELLADSGRFGCLVLGPGLGDSADGFVARVVEQAELPVVLDADGLRVAHGRPEVLNAAKIPPVITPHDGEYARIVGEEPGADRVAACVGLAQRAGAIVLLKGPTTVVASPTGAAWLVISGDQRLATAGSGDVLAGMIGAVLAEASVSASTGPDDIAGLVASTAHWHGRAAALGPAGGVVAADIVESIGSARVAM